MTKQTFLIRINIDVDAENLAEAYGVVTRLMRRRADCGGWGLSSAEDHDGREFNEQEILNAINEYHTNIRPKEMEEK